MHASVGMTGRRGAAGRQLSAVLERLNVGDLSGLLDLVASGEADLRGLRASDAVYVLCVLTESGARDQTVFDRLFTAHLATIVAHEQLVVSAVHCGTRAGAVLPLDVFQAFCALVLRLPAEAGHPCGSRTSLDVLVTAVTGFSSGYLLTQAARRHSGIVQQSGSIAAGAGATPAFFGADLASVTAAVLAGVRAVAAAAPSSPAGVCLWFFAAACSLPGFLFFPQRHEGGPHARLPPRATPPATYDEVGRADFLAELGEHFGHGVCAQEGEAVAVNMEEQASAEVVVQGDPPAESGQRSRGGLLSLLPPLACDEADVALTSREWQRAVVRVAGGGGGSGSVAAEAAELARFSPSLRLELAAGWGARRGLAHRRARTLLCGELFVRRLLGAGLGAGACGSGGAGGSTGALLEVFASAFAAYPHAAGLASTGELHAGHLAVGREDAAFTHSLAGLAFQVLAACADDACAAPETQQVLDRVTEEASSWLAEHLTACCDGVALDRGGGGGGAGYAEELLACAADALHALTRVGKQSPALWLAFVSLYNQTGVCDAEGRRRAHAAATAAAGTAVRPPASQPFADALAGGRPRGAAPYAGAGAVLGPSRAAAACQALLFFPYPVGGGGREAAAAGLAAVLQAPTEELAAGLAAEVACGGPCVHHSGDAAVRDALRGGEGAVALVLESLFLVGVRGAPVQRAALRWFADPDGRGVRRQAAVAHGALRAAAASVPAARVLEAAVVGGAWTARWRFLAARFGGGAADAALRAAQREAAWTYDTLLLYGGGIEVVKAHWVNLRGARLPWVRPALLRTHGRSPAAAAAASVDAAPVLARLHAAVAAQWDAKPAHLLLAFSHTLEAVPRLVGSRYVAPSLLPLVFYPHARLAVRPPAVLERTLLRRLSEVSKEARGALPQACRPAELLWSLTRLSLSAHPRVRGVSACFRRSLRRHPMGEVAKKKLLAEARWKDVSVQAFLPPP